MDCLTCNEFDQLKIVADQMGPKVPGIKEAINAFLMWHLAVVHNLGYDDLHAAAVAPRPTPGGPSSYGVGMVGKVPGSA